MTEEQDDGGVLDDLQDVVDVALGENLGPAEPEDPWERRQRLLDSWTAIILAIAAIATAWGAFQASQWSGAQSDAERVSATARADAGRAATAATEATIVDTQMWLSWLDAVTAKQSLKAAFLEDRFSPQLAKAQQKWLGGVTLDANGTPIVVPPGTPLTLPTYIIPAQVVSDRDAARAEAQLEYADAAAGISTRYVVLSVIFALVFFFAGVALKFSAPRTQVVLTLLAVVMLVLGVVRLLMLPQYVWSRPDPPPAAAISVVVR
jgi:hypothetical protein